MIEKRKYVRKPIGLNQNFIIFDKIEENSPDLLDICESGFSIRHNKQCEVSDVLGITVYVDNTKLEVKCRVIYSYEVREGVFRTGFKFLAVKRPAMQQLIKYLE